MDINVTIKCPDLTLAAAALAKAILNTQSPSCHNSATEDSPKAEPGAVQAQVTANPTHVAAATAPAQTPIAPSQTAVPTTPAPGITGDMVAKAGADLIAVNPAVMGPLNALLQKYGVSCAQELRIEQIGPFATEMRALGAKI